jgi:hypothetical protein
MRAAAGDAGIGVEADLVEHLPLFFVAENFIGFGDGFELFLGGFVAWVQVGVVLAG